MLRLQHLENREGCMSKEKQVRREEKKKPQKSAKEKRIAKQEKKKGKSS